MLINVKVWEWANHHVGVWIRASMQTRRPSTLSWPLNRECSRRPRQLQTQSEELVDQRIEVGTPLELWNPDQPQYDK